MPDTEKLIVRTDPAKFKIGKSSAARLSAMTGLSVDSLVGETIGSLTKKFPHQIDPQLFLFRRICGKVVKTDPATGIDYPVAFATVQVEDTDCSFLGYFPKVSRWSWYYPFRCRREVIATVKTDACGNFCVWIPRFDIDWVLRFRRERVCFPIIFDRPDLSDLLDQVIPRPIPDFPRGPQPDPSPLGGIDFGPLVGRIRESFGRDVSLRAAGLRTTTSLGADFSDKMATLGAPARLEHLAPPIGPELRALSRKLPKGARGGASISHPAVETLSAQLGLKPTDIKGFDLRRYVGPFKRCFDVFFPEWKPILDVPDITFKVLQDTNGDGTLDQIYGEGYFQVRWNSGSINNLILHAGPNARASVACDVPQISCGNVPAIVNAGLLALHDGLIYDDNNGYAVRTNRPHPSGSFSEALPASPAEAPFTGTLQLYGCNATNPSATHYRLVYRFSADGGVTFTPPTPFVNYSWVLDRLNAAGVDEHHTVTPDSQGWYPIALPAGPNDWHPHNLLLNWTTGNSQDGLYMVRIEVGTGGAALGPAVPEMAFTIDNSRPTAEFTVETSDTATGPFTPIQGTCPVVKRGTAPRDIYFRVTLEASATHLRSVSMSANDCGDGTFVMEPGTTSGGLQNPPGGATLQHWHVDVDDNSQTLQAVYKLPATAAQGTYGFSSEVAGRAFNPAGGDTGFSSVPQWQYDPVYSVIYPSISFSVFNSN